MSLVYLYDGSFEGLLTAVFEGYAAGQHPDAVAEEEGLQVDFGQEVRLIGTDGAKARRVERGIVTKMGREALEDVWTAYLSSSPGKGTAVYRYLRRGFEIGWRIAGDLAHPAVLELEAIRRLVGREAHLLKEFLRFSEMEGGVFYAKITPEHRIVPLLMPHFTERYSVQPFLIHDVTHGIVGVFDLKGWHMVETDGITLPDESYNELEYKRMWKRFYETIAIRERLNPRCQRGHLPGKFRHNMTEFSFVETPKTRAMDERMRKMPVTWEG